MQPRNHVEFLVKVGKQNFGNDGIDEGRRIFEAVLTGQPKRTDVQSAQVDLETKQSDKSARALHLTRAVFSRAVECGAGYKKIQKLFEKWMNWEQKYGKEDTQASVEDMAKAYVEKQLSSNQAQEEDK